MRVVAVIFVSPSDAGISSPPRRMRRIKERVFTKLLSVISRRVGAIRIFDML